MTPTPSTPLTAASYQAGSLDDDARMALGRLDPRKATPESVQAALGAVGVYLSMDACAELLDGGRAS